MSEVCEVHFCVKPDHNLETLSIIKLQKKERKKKNTNKFEEIPQEVRSLSPCLLTCGICLFRENLVDGEGSRRGARFVKITYLLLMQIFSCLPYFTT